MQLSLQTHVPTCSLKWFNVTVTKLCCSLLFISSGLRNMCIISYLPMFKTLYFSIFHVLRRENQLIVTFSVFCNLIRLPCQVSQFTIPEPVIGTDRHDREHWKGQYCHVQIFKRRSDISVLIYAFHDTVA